MTLLFMFILAHNCFANDYTLPIELQIRYKKEIQKTIKKEVPKTKNNINKEFLKAQKTYNQFINDNVQNSDKYIYLIQDYQRGIETYEMIFISKLIDITAKYKDINQDVPPTDFPGTLLDFIYPYFDANNIDYSQINELDSFCANKIKNLDILLQNM